MFDIGFSELFVVAIVALLVLGPERLPRAARFAGLWARRARAQWDSVKSELENELADDELKRNLRQTREDLRAAQAQLRDGGRTVRREVEAMDPAHRTNRSDSSQGGDRDGDPARAPQRDPAPGRPSPSEQPERRDPDPGRVPRRDPGQSPDKGDPDPGGPDEREPDAPPLKRSPADPADLAGPSKPRQP